MACSPELAENKPSTSSPIAWSSKQIGRVVRSTLSAEAYMPCHHHWISLIGLGVCGDTYLVLHFIGRNRKSRFRHFQRLWSSL